MLYRSRSYRQIIPALGVVLHFGRSRRRSRGREEDGVEGNWSWREGRRGREKEEGQEGKDEGVGGGRN